MINVRMKIAYDGQRYKGWQRLSDEDDTVQGKIESCISRFFGEPIEVIGASRTDSGVHALGQIANFYVSEACLETVIERKKNQEKQLRDALNSHLTDDIRILEIDFVNERFHSRFHCVSKTYHYQIVTSEVMNPLLRKTHVHTGKLKVKEMKKAALMLLGEHDFTTFTNVKAKKKSMVRHLESIQFIEEKDHLTVEYTANGFLHHMVRRIMGTLIEVGLGERSVDELKEMLEQKERKRVTYVAPAHGLCLMTISFGKLT